MEVTRWVLWSQVIPGQWHGVGSVEDQAVRAWVGSAVMADLRARRERPSGEREEVRVVRRRRREEMKGRVMDFVIAIVLLSMQRGVAEREGVSGVREEVGKKTMGCFEGAEERGRLEF